MEEKRILKNGIALYFYRNEVVHSFHLSLFLRAGSMYERKEECGVTHFFEHIAIRNVNAAMDGRLYAMLDKAGIEFNASTYSEMVQFYASGATKNFEVAASSIAALFSPLCLTRSEIDMERKRIKAEIRELDDASSLSSFSQKCVWGETSLSRSIAGTLGGVSKINASVLEGFRRKSFTKDNLFLYLTGNFTESQISYLSELIGSWELYDGEARENFAPVPENFGNRGGNIALKSCDYTKLKFNFDIDMKSVSVPECDLLYEILFGGYNSPFFIELSEKRGLFYDLTGSVERYRNIGVLSFAFEVRENDVYEAVRLAVDILNKYKRVPVPDGKCMKAGFVDNADMLLDEPRELNFTFAYDNHILNCGYSSVDKRRAAYRAVSPEGLRLIANEIFKTKNLTLAVKGNKKRIDTEKIKDIILSLDSNG